MYAGIDLGGTKILVLVADASGNVVGDARVPTLAHEGSERVIERIGDALAEAAREAGIAVSQIRRAGVSAPGPIDLTQGVLTEPPNLPGWHNVPLARLLRQRTGVDTVLENDANCGALGEHRYGAGRGYRHMIYVTASTGIGGGIIIDGALYTGASGAAGEVGHLVVSESGRTCNAGHLGCLEAYASGTGIAARAAEAIAAGRLPRTARLAEQNPPLSAEDVYLAGQQGEEEAAAIIESAGRYLGMGLASLINAFNPEAIVVGGGLMHMGQAFLGPAVEEAQKRSFGQSYGDVKILEWELGERVAALGAIAVARDRG